MARAAVRLVQNINSAELKRRQVNDALGWLDSIAPNSGAALPATDPALDGRVFVKSPPGELYAQIGGTWVLVGQPAALRGYIDGLILSTAGSSATFGIAAGAAADSTAAVQMKLASAYTKTTSAWALGTAAGALDTGTIANNTWYHVHLIRRPDTGVVDVLVSLSATSPTMPTNYSQRRRIGSLRTNGSGQWVKFFQDGDDFLWDVSVLSVNGQTVDTASRLYVMTVPTAVRVTALINALALNGGTGSALLVSSPNQSTMATATPAGNVNLIASASGDQAAELMRVLTDTSAQLRFVANAANITLYVNTLGWTDRRGKDL